jgi:hypothetical protein
LEGKSIDLDQKPMLKGELFDLGLSEPTPIIAPSKKSHSGISWMG